MSMRPKLAVIGGSGLYNMPGLAAPQEFDIDTPFGKPSAPIMIGTLVDQPVAFLARHGLGHTLSPSEINYRANIYALKSLGVEQIISVSAVGSLREDYAPGDLVIPDGLFDHTKKREMTFFEGGLVAHVGVADPFCPALSEQLYEAVQATGATVHEGGSFITIEGPRFSTKAESNIYRGWGLSIIGMTTSPEAYLAREAEIHYAVMAHVTDYDSWHEEEEPVTVEMVIAIMNKNLETAQQAVAIAVERLAGNFAAYTEPFIENALATAILTNHNAIPAAAIERLRPLIDKYFD